MHNVKVSGLALLTALVAAVGDPVAGLAGIMNFVMYVASASMALRILRELTSRWRSPDPSAVA